MREYEELDLSEWVRRLDLDLPPLRRVEDVCADLPCMHPHVQRLAGGGHYCTECQQEVHVT